MGKKKTQEAVVEKEEWINPTPVGEKKDLRAEMAPTYQREQVEAAWDDWWETSGFYKPRGDGEPFVMVLPPPNVTGTLHLGHALMSTIEDAIARYQRMKGRAVVWVPGTDHAGIATQAVVEKMLWKKHGLTRHDLGREKFTDEIWKWKEEHGGAICGQLRRLGSSLDWSREAFTMDDNLSRAVKEAFVRMHSSGKLFRANRLVNWSCALRTAISNVEVDSYEIKQPEFLKVPGHEKSVELGVIHSFAYKFADGSDEEIVVATTRLETMLGDVAVAVHPKDPRYTHIHGKTLVHPFHPNRVVKIVLDDVLVQMEFGTGAVKVTPAHDLNDFACGVRHGLEMISIFDDDGRVNAEGGEFEGMMRYDARRACIARLEELGLYRGKAPNPMVVGRCSRSKDLVEPMLKPQWWVDCDEMAKRSTDAVRNGELEILPESQKRVWFQWLDNIQPWCISRQLWWGHRIPAYRILLNGVRADDDSDMQYWAVAKSEEEAIVIGQERFPGATITVEQDEDVLDTWFSSGIFPFSVFQWPEQTDDLARFFPTTLLETGHDILFFWVARMVMMGLELTDTLPFKTIFLHPMVRDKYGRKMSKSLGNVIDPLDVIQSITLEELFAKLESGNLPENEVKKAKAGQKKDYPKGIPECGADALRFTLLDYLAQDRNINLDVSRVEGYRQFCNKMWNAMRFSLSFFDEDFVYNPELNLAELSFADQWILNTLGEVIKTCNEGFENYKFNMATTATFDFWMKQFCPVYLEASKPLMGGAHSKTVQQVLYRCLDVSLRLMHPLMPFVTEELWQRLPGRKTEESIMISEYPQAMPELENSSSGVDMVLTLDILHHVNSSRDALEISPKEMIQAIIKVSDASILSTVERGLSILSTIGRLSSVTAIGPDTADPKKCIAVVVNNEVVIHIAVEGVINLDKQVEKLSKRFGKLQKWISTKEALYTKPTYVEKTPEEVRSKHSAELTLKLEERTKLDDAINGLKSLQLE